jgi:hypothetical protein
MKRYIWLLVVLGSGLLIGAVLASCAPDTSAPELQARAESDQLGAQNEAPSQFTSAESGTPIAVVEFTDFACLDCHSDEALVKELAVEEEEEESLSSGPG